MATTNRAVDLLNQSVAAQSQTLPQAEDQHAWKTRYIFVPFRTRPLTTMYMSLWNLPLGLRQGVIERIARFTRSEIDYQEVARVPTDQWGNPVPTSPGVEERKREDRQPFAVVTKILESHNPNFVSGGVDDNGIVEIKSLIGLDDLNLYAALQAHFLPDIYKTAREQLAQITGAIESAGKRVTDGYRWASAGDELLASTEAAVRWGMAKYGALQVSVEEFGRTGTTGKRELSQFDRDLCRWLEVPAPRLQTMLQNFQDAKQAGGQVVPQGQQLPSFTVCPDCGNMINLLPDGALPRRGCIVCQWNPNATASAEQAEFEAVTGGKPTFANMQAEIVKGKK